MTVDIYFNTPKLEKQLWKTLGEEVKSHFEYLQTHTQMKVVTTLRGHSGQPELVILKPEEKSDSHKNPLYLGALVAKSLDPGSYRIANSSASELELFCLGWQMATYKYTRYLNNASAGSEISQTAFPELLTPKGVNQKQVNILAESTFWVRDLINTPANELGTEELSEQAHQLAKELDGKFTLIQGETLEKDFPLVATVGRASSRSPRLVDLTFGDETHPKLTLVGKGVVYDTGGLDIKPSSSMKLMKKDMGGAAHALGLAKIILRSKLKVRLRVIIPIVENAISGSSFRTGDIIRSRKGMTVEIGNTDAEGRLILADALTLASEEEPDLLIDFATLTGAARVAVGPDMAPFYTRNNDLARKLMEYAESQVDPLWPMPLYSPYKNYLESSIADISSTGSLPFAGSITAALFLSRFIEDEKSWIHFDIFGWNVKSRPDCPEGGHAQALRALQKLLVSRYA